MNDEYPALRARHEYDSRLDTLLHIRRVQELLGEAITVLTSRSRNHDASKLREPEKGGFDEFTPRLAEVEYGSEEYKACLRQMKPFLDHHYANNAHHPEYHPAGIASMSLVDLLEMLADWKAAGERGADGDLRRSIEVNQQRFGYGSELKRLLMNTAEAMGWL